jgi:hypothetical protein
VERVVNDPVNTSKLEGLIACAGDRIGFWGDIRIVEREPVSGGKK